jgi:hypothetical protein
LFLVLKMDTKISSIIVLTKLVYYFFIILSAGFGLNALFKTDLFCLAVVVLGYYFINARLKLCGDSADTCAAEDNAQNDFFVFIKADRR